jgi:hypothetical protein
MPSSRALADLLERTVAAEVVHLRAVPDSGTSRPNRPSGKGWSMREELGHLVDSAVNNHARIVGAALDGSFSGPGYGQERWVAVHRYAAIPWPDLVEIWRAHNAVLVPLIAGIPDASLAAPCSVGDAPPVPLGLLVDDYVLHMRHHLDQVLRREPVTRYPRA